ncbi:hypothetical protein AVEN_89905-1 [Araneus ventricosus]|uniref:Uncharacterized protein n=1 Tax=Araneus ventricosus TaxID=182803 RepID=A0A4Y2MYD2_ARAVE|nr:hypothetical protein AVEN_89905-1 [Araneus ventricosus]
MEPGIVMQKKNDTITQHAKTFESDSFTFNDTLFVKNKQTTARFSKRQPFSKRLHISISLTRLQTYTTNTYKSYKAIITICLHSEEKYSLHINYFSKAAACNLFFGYNLVFINMLMFSG